MLNKRVTSSILLAGLVCATIFVDWLCGLFVSLFIIAGLYEFFTMLEHKGIRAYKYFGIGMGAVIPFSILFRFQLTQKWELLFIVAALIFLIIMQFKRRENTGVIVDISTTIFGILYVSWFFSFLIKIRYMPGGIGLLTAVILITKMGDIGAYLVGVRFGKTPLIPRISPKKSMEGSAAGLLFNVLAAFISKPFLDLPYWHLILFAIGLGILGQLGDLSESLMKRDCQVKDSGVLLPGMGGVLDLMDSLLFTAPAFYFYLNIM
ncbi:MAG: phosphatidate cytidylyltransferase [Candidatus Omnitrophota bacterium]